MTRAEIFEKLNEVFKDVFDDDSIVVNEETISNDIDGWDSLQHITLIAAIENEFDVEFEMKDIIKLINVGKLADVIEKEI